MLKESKMSISSAVEKFKGEVTETRGCVMVYLRSAGNSSIFLHMLRLVFLERK